MGATWRWMALSAVAGVLLGAALVAILRDDPKPAPARPRISATQTPPGADEILELREQLAAQQTLGRALQAEVAQLRERVEELGTELGGGIGTPESEGRDELAARRQGSVQPPAWFDAIELIDLGVAPAEVAAIRETFDAHQLDILYLRDRAAREGWDRKPRFANELASMRATLREELGDEDFDLLLWATGQNNRVVLSSLLTGSPALAARLEDGDVVVRYADAAIFNGRELQLATRAGEAGQQVRMDVLRGSEELRIYVPRGPLGVQLRPARRPPEPR